ncbi:MAG: DUF4031 domain-containing protein [Sporichthyaceae bacterium]|nr:DUF4031 domain-containing protein [Sporichthyaceae bacterium]
MSLLVDSAMWPGRGRTWCHLASDSSFEELHAFAAAFGLPPGAFDGDHYDLPAERRPAAIAAGAQPVSSAELVRRLSAAGLRRRKRRGINASPTRE